MVFVYYLFSINVYGELVFLCCEVSSRERKPSMQHCAFGKKVFDLG
jgi:hypothetical protein